MAPFASVALHLRFKLIRSPLNQALTAMCSIVVRCSFMGSILMSMCVSGCGQHAERSRNSPTSAASDAYLSESAAAPQGVQGTAGEAAIAATGAAVSDPANPLSENQHRRIVYNTSLSLVVKDYNVFESKLPGMVQAFGGFVSKSETNRRYSDQQSGLWVVRVPVDRYGEFLSGVTGLGFAESRREDAQDVTDEFVDVEARIRNNKKLEERIIEMVAERTGKIADVLEIERELARVREEIERMEGRLRLLADRSALATITIQCREELEYSPPTAPTLGSRVSHSWSGSLATMQTVAENLAVATVAVIPWLALLAIPGFLIAVFVRRKRRSR